MDRMVILIPSDSIDCNLQDIYQMIADQWDPQMVEGIGKIGGQYQITFKSKKFMNKFLQKGNFPIRGDNFVQVRRMGNKVHQALIHGVPHWVPNQCIAEAVGDLVGTSEVEADVVYSNQPGFSEVTTSIRRIFSPITLQSLPDLMIIVHGGSDYKFQVMVEVMGRPLRCFSCGQLGHVKSACPNSQSSTGQSLIQVSTNSQRLSLPHVNKSPASSVVANNSPSTVNDSDQTVDFQQKTMITNDVTLEDLTIPEELTNADSEWVIPPSNKKSKK